jgi:hypothetical protein
MVSIKQIKKPLIPFFLQKLFLFFFYLDFYHFNFNFFILRANKIKDKSKENYHGRVLTFFQFDSIFTPANVSI